MRLFLLAFLLSLGASAQSDRWEDVHVYVGKDRFDGIVNFVPQTKVLVMVVNDKNRIAQAIPYNAISKMVYQPKNDHNVFITFRDASGNQATAQIHPHGGNRDRLIAMLGSTIGIPVTVER